MFVDFNRVFNNKPQTEIRVPEALVDYLSAGLPKGLRYQADDAGNLRIVAENGPFTIGGLVLKPTEEQTKILRKKYTAEEVLKYSYNAQKPIPFELEKEGIIILNGEEIPIEKLAFNPYYPINYNSNSVLEHASISPPPFPGPFSIVVGCNEYSAELKVKRIPNDSVHVAKYESERDKPLLIEYSIDESKQQFSFHISFDLLNAKSIQEIVESTTIYNAFVEGNGKVNGISLFSNNDSSISKKYDSESIAFWEKVLQIEKKLGVSFVPMKDDVDYSTLCVVETLYQNLINKKPIRINKKIESIDGAWEGKKEDEIKKSIGTALLFEYQTTAHNTLFGVETALPCLVEVFNSRFVSYSAKDKKYKIVLEHESEDKKMYVSEQRFLTEDEIKSFTKIKLNDRIKEFYEAKTVQYYLDEQ